MSKTVSYFLAVIALVLGYYYPHNSAPLVTFHVEWFFAVGWIFLTAAFLLDAKVVDQSLAPKSWTVMLLPLSLALAASIDYFFGRNEYPGSLILYLIYLAMLAASIWLGVQVASQSNTNFSKRFFIVFSATILGAALLNGLAGFIQILGWNVSGWLVVPVGDATRMFGNIRQPNLYSTLLTMGTIALMGLSFGLSENRHVLRPWMFICVAVFLGLASSLSASRTGLVLIVVVAVAAWTGKGLPRLSQLIATVAAVATVTGWAVLSKMGAAGEVAYSGLQRLDISTGADFSSRRDILWGAMLELIRAHPLVGSGFNRLNYDYFMLDVPRRIAFNLQNAHNIPLQIAVEHGVIFAAAWIAVLCFVLWSVRKTWSIPVARLCWMVLIALGIHSCLEYPLWYLYFLLPAGLVLGAVIGFGASTLKPRVDVEIVTGSKTAVRPGLISIATLVALIAAGGIYRDYAKVLPVFQAASPMDVMGLIERGYTTRLYTAWMDYAVVANTPVTPDNAKLHNRISTRLSTFSIANFVVMNLALSNAMLGKNDEANFYLGRLKEMYGDNFLTYVKQVTPAEMEYLKPALAKMKDVKQ